MKKELAYFPYPQSHSHLCLCLYVRDRNCMMNGLTAMVMGPLSRWWWVDHQGGLRSNSVTKSTHRSAPVAAGSRPGAGPGARPGARPEPGAPLTHTH